MTPEQVLEQAMLAVRFAREYTDDVEFSPEDGGRSDPDFLCRVLEAVIAEGATTINIPDTVGYAMPRAVRRRSSRRCASASRIPTRRSGRCTATTTSAWRWRTRSPAVMIGGARQVECTINGLGERAGNCSLEEIVMAVRTRKDFFTCTTRHRRDADRRRRRKLVSRITGFPVQPNKAVVGANAFAHESGIHQDGVLKRATPTRSCAPRTWAGAPTRSCSASSPAATRSSSGCRSSASSSTGRRRVNAAFARFKELADKKGEIFDEDLHALVSEEGIVPAHEHYRLVALRGHIRNRRAAARARRDGRRRCGGRRRSRRRRPGRRRASRRSSAWRERRGAAALFGQRDHRRHRIAGRGDGAAASAAGGSSTASAPTPTSSSLRPRPTSMR